MFSKDYEVLVKHLRAATKQSGFTQVEIAQRLNRPPAYLSKVLNRHQTLTLIEIRNICQAADIPFLQWVSELDEILDRRS